MQLPVFDIITQAFSDTWENRGDLQAFAFLPVFMAAIVGTLIFSAIGDPEMLIGNPDVVVAAPEAVTETPGVVIDEGETTADQTAQVPQSFAIRWLFGNLVNWIVNMALYTIFAVAWHRRILVGREAVSVGTTLRWGRRQWQFFRYLAMLIVNLAMLLVISSLLLKFVFPTILAFSGMLIVACLLYSRACLILPAAAIDKPMTIAESAQLTTGNGWRILVAVILPQLLLMLITGVAVALLLISPDGVFGTSISALFLLALAAESVKYIGFAIGINALSLAYRQLTA